MTSGLLFKWEDTPALSHHCGFCERPLSHPGARASCFGTHSEPCHRYHQAMFMRLRSHTCHYCRTIDEAHHRRHKKIAESIRDVYDSCGVFDWTIIPSEFEESSRGKVAGSFLAESNDTCQSLAPEDTPSSKRERKDAKSLARAASRTRVISHDEILYIDSVIHLAEGISSAERDEPRTTEDMDEIDRHLKYNAHVYNAHGDRRNLKKFARLPDVDVDFEAEMKRILEAFRITALLQHNTRNRGLQGRELKIFQSMVKELQKALVDDLVLVKRDSLETRMRRAGYLRYTNKAAHDIVEDRYAHKDWKTGERYSTSTSDASGIASPNEEARASSSIPSQSLPQLPSATPDHGSDRRHLEMIHKRVNGDDGLMQNIIEPYHAPLLSLSTGLIARKPAVQLKVVTNKAASQKMEQKGPTHKETAYTEAGTWQTVLHGKKPTTPSIKPPWGLTVTGRPVAASPRHVHLWGPDARELPDLQSFRAPAVQPPNVAMVTTSMGPDRLVGPGDSAPNESIVSHAVVTQKKEKEKYGREARRKAKKSFIQEETNAMKDNAARYRNAVLLRASTLVAAGRVQSDAAIEDKSPCILSPNGITSKAVAEVTTISTDDMTMLGSSIALPCPTYIPIVYNSKHIHWTKFKRRFIVDQLTGPFLTLSSGCSHGINCVFESNEVPDCPFHEPHCVCVDPLRDECFLVYPGREMLSSGPYNRLRGEKLLALYQCDEHFKDRIMLVDDDLIDYFMLGPTERTQHRDMAQAPKRLATEYTDLADGSNPGPLMEQERKFERLWNKNNVIKRQLSREMLSAIQHEKFENTNTPFICYCHSKMPEDNHSKPIVECAHRDCSLRFFHKSCVKKLGFEKMSRWFCTMCEQQMRLLAHQTLRDLGYNNIADEDGALNESIEKIKQKLQIPDAAIGQLRARMEEMGGSSRLAGVMAVRVADMF